MLFFNLSIDLVSQTLIVYTFGTICKFKDVDITLLSPLNCPSGATDKTCLFLGLVSRKQLYLPKPRSRNQDNLILSKICNTVRFICN